MTDAVDLDKLKAEIDAIGEKIKSLKSATGEVDKDGIAAAVASLVAAKKTYADNNNGIGVDGKPFEEPLTKAQKKAKAKAEAGAAPGPAKPVRPSEIRHPLALALAPALGSIASMEWNRKLTFMNHLRHTSTLAGARCRFERRTQESRQKGRSQGQEGCCQGRRS
jgi:hypothetical protein